MSANACERDLQAAAASLADALKGIDGPSLLALMRGPDGPLIRADFPMLSPWCTTMADSRNALTIDASGNVTTCCYDAKGANRFANIYQDGIAEVWRRYNAILVSDLYKQRYCANCCIGKGMGWSPPLVDPEAPRRRVEWVPAPYPTRLIIEPSAACNYACEGCPANSNTGAMADLDKLFDGLKDALPHLQFMGVGLYGEPLLHKGLADFLLRCRALAPAMEIQVLTNGMAMTDAVSHGLVKAGVDVVTVAIHAGPGTENMLRYSKKAADYPRVLRNLAGLVAARDADQKPRMRIEVRTVLFDWNDTDEDMDMLTRDILACGVRINEKLPGQHHADRAFWVLDVAQAQGHPRSSKRFTPGSADLQQLIEAKRFNPV